MRDIDRQKILVAVDVVVFTVLRSALQVLLIKRKNPPFQQMFAFPGGFVKDTENLETAAVRELEEETGVKDIFIKKLTAYGELNRDPRGRVVTVVYIALIDAEQFQLKATTDAMAAEWVAVDDMPQLAFDHNQILQDCLTELRFEIQTTNIAAQLLPEKFTLTALQNLYEVILGKKLDKRNFRKRIKSLAILRETRETKMEGAHRPAKLYRFKDRTYHPLKEKVHIFV